MAERDAKKVAESFAATMRRACDATEAHRTKDAVIVPTRYWHRLMDLAAEARGEQ